MCTSVELKRSNEWTGELAEATSTGILGMNMKAFDSTPRQFIFWAELTEQGEQGHYFQWLYSELLLPMHLLPGS